MGTIISCYKLFKVIFPFPVKHTLLINKLRIFSRRFRRNSPSNAQQHLKFLLIMRLVSALTLMCLVAVAVTVTGQRRGRRVRSRPRLAKRQSLAGADHMLRLQVQGIELNLPRCSTCNGGHCQKYFCGGNKGRAININGTTTFTCSFNNRHDWMVGRRVSFIPQLLWWGSYTCNSCGGSGINALAGRNEDDPEEEKTPTVTAAARVKCWLCAMSYDEGDPKALKERSECAILSCGHHLCLECFRGYVNSKLVQDKIPCQHLGCNTNFQDVEIERYMTNDKYKTRYKNVTGNMLQSALGENYTTCPYDCGADFWVDSVKTAKAQSCPQCRHPVCEKCKEKWTIGSGATHAGFTCEEWKRRMDPDYQANEAYLARNTKDCPNCGRAISKNNGCNHMTCDEDVGGCGHEWCWTCRGPARPGGPCYTSSCRTRPGVNIRWH